MRRTIALIAVVLTANACSKSDDPSKVPLGAATSQVPGMGDALTGTVLEQIPASPYVYLHLQTANGDVWAAVNEAPIQKGAQVSVYNSILMEKFESATLKRTFDQIYFGTLTPPSASPGIAAGNGAPASVGTPPTVDAKVEKVEKASGSDARTISELWAQKDALSGKTVSIRGVVVKYNAEVMGKNWIHLQDGSGNAATGTHDIAVTTKDPAVVGATVTITGTVGLNREFGAGYNYALIVEDAKVVAK